MLRGVGEERSPVGKGGGGRWGEGRFLGGGGGGWGGGGGGTGGGGGGVAF